MVFGQGPALSLQLSNILFASDFPPCSEEALPLARSIAARFGSTIHFLHVLSPEPHLPAPLDHPPELDVELQQAREHIQQLLCRNPLPKIAHRVLIKRGELKDVLQQAIKDQKIDLVVLGTHGRRGLSKLALGSVAEEIFRSASCPVLTVGPHLPPDGLGESQLSTILYATDFSEGSSLALMWALEWTRQSHARLAMVHVLPEIPEVPQAELEDIIRGVRRQLSLSIPRGMELLAFDPVVLFGSAAHGILRAAEEQKASLIVMSVRAASGLPGASHIPWATAYQVVCEAKCPVLTLRRFEHATAEADGTSAEREHAA
jgi:nucleotide-binding universal stress UspA family protein